MISSTTSVLYAREKLKKTGKKTSNHNNQPLPGPRKRAFRWKNHKLKRKTSMNTEYDSGSLLSIQQYYGRDITSDQQDWLNFEVDKLCSVEQGKYFDAQKINPEFN